MSLNDWTQFVSGSSTIETDFDTPILGTGSLRVSCIDTEKALLLNTTLYTPGLLKGRMRSLFRLDDVTGSNTYRYGFTLFQSAADITASGSAYLYGIEVEESELSNTPFFDVCGTRLDEGRTRYFAGTPFIRVNGTTVVALEVEWSYEPTLLGGTRFILREGDGTLTDFSNLTTLTTLELYPGASPTLLTVSSGEGLFVGMGTGVDSSTFLDLHTDYTTIVSLT